MRFIKDVKQWYKMWSVWFFAIVGVYQWAEANLALLQALIPAKFHGYIGAFLAVMGILSRLVAQPNLTKE